MVKPPDLQRSDLVLPRDNGVLVRRVKQHHFFFFNQCWPIAGSQNSCLLCLGADLGSGQQYLVNSLKGEFGKGDGAGSAYLR